MKRSLYFFCCGSLLFTIPSYGASPNAVKLSPFEEVRVPAEEVCTSQSSLRKEIDPLNLLQLQNFTDDVRRLYNDIYNSLMPELIYSNGFFFKRFLKEYPQIQPDIEEFIAGIQFITRIEKVAKKPEHLYLDPWYFEDQTVDRIISNLQNQFEEIKTNSKKFESFNEWLRFLFNLEKITSVLEGYISEIKGQGR